MENEENRVIDTNAQASALGWDFQSSLALFFVVDDIKNLESVKVEGKTEDIELVYNNGSTIFIQAKSQLDPYNSNTTNLHLKNGIKTLINTSQENEYTYLIYGTNINNPFVYREFVSLFAGNPTNYSFNELPKKIQDKIIKNANSVAKNEKLSLKNFDYNRLRILTLPFYGEEDKTRYRFIKEKILSFLDAIGLTGTQADRIFNSFLLDFTKNASKSISLQKEDLAWTIIIFTLDVRNDEFFEEFDLGIAEEDAIENIYGSFIEQKSLDFSLLNEVGGHFKELDKLGMFDSNRAAPREFINITVAYYEKKIFFEELDQLTPSVTKYILWKILKKRRTIERLSREVGI